ncbi:Dyp-type peroxidase [Streptomyces sp. NPDC051684]|uniref:Dyp-type peroxidase n=1 Tax=Streptomyces sp. NPDC051684 TaxID=3365670 RepID=UPI003788FFA3
MYTSSRRAVLTAAALAGAASGCARAPRDAADDRPATPFYGTHQAGVLTPPQPSVLIVSYDLGARTRGAAGARALRSVLAAWSRLLGERDRELDAADGRLASARTSRLTATVAVGPALPRRLGLRSPALLRELPAFPGDRLEERRGSGDVLVQVCADDAWTCNDAALALDDAAAGVLTPRWRQPGFLPPTGPGRTPRNLFGFLDGTANPAPADAPRHVHVANGPDRGGSYLVYRRIRMDLAAFAALDRGRQERIMGRHRVDGAPLGGRREHDEVNLFAKRPDGEYVVPADAHVRLAHPRLDGGAQMLRRGYSYADAADDQGLLFLAYMKDPDLFVRVQERLAGSDALNRFTRHTASAVAYVLPGVRRGESLGAPLL